MKAFWMLTGALFICELGAGARVKASVPCLRGLTSGKPFDDAICLRFGPDQRVI